MRGNTVSVKGNVTRDMEVRRVGESNAASWGLAWNSRRKNRATGDYEDVPHYFDVECWASDRQLALLEGKVVKGARCAVVDAHLEQQRWEKDGQQRSKVVIRVDDPVGGLLVEPGGRQGGAQRVHAEVYDEPPVIVYDSDIPF